MRRLGKLCLVVVILGLFLYYKPVYAEEYFRNQYGVSFTREAYDFFTELFYDGYQNLMTQEMYDEYEGFDFVNDEIEKVSLCVNDMPISMRDTVSPQDLTHFANYSRSLDLAKVCGALCRAALVVTWLGEPSVKSYDLAGAYLSGPTRISTPATTYSSTLESGLPSAMVYEDDGFGAVVPVPDGENIRVSQSFAYTGHGVIFMTHQHAVENISLTNAQSFTIGLSGYGNVFQFYGGAVDKYDQMNGVYITV